MNRLFVLFFVFVSFHFVSWHRFSSLMLSWNLPLSIVSVFSDIWFLFLTSCLWFEMRSGGSRLCAWSFSFWVVVFRKGIVCFCVVLLGYRFLLLFWITCVILWFLWLFQIYCISNIMLFVNRIQLIIQLCLLIIVSYQFLVFIVMGLTSELSAPNVVVLVSYLIISDASCPKRLIFGYGCSCVWFVAL